MGSNIAIYNAPQEVRIQYVMEQHTLPPEERHEDYYQILETVAVEDLPKELQGHGFFQLPASGELSLAQIGEEGGVAIGTQIGINNAACRDLIGKAAQTQMAFSEWYGASNVPPINWGAASIYKTDVPVQAVIELGNKYSAYTCRYMSMANRSGSMPAAQDFGAAKISSSSFYLFNTSSSESQYNAFKYLKWEIDGVAEEGINVDWRYAPYIYGDRDQYTIPAMLGGSKNGAANPNTFWNTFNTGKAQNAKLYFGNDA